MTGNEKICEKKNYVILHGHFYQPPRENPWLDIIEKQDSAFPDHDWNERIYNQCYRPNATSRILDSQGMIVDIHNNYECMSFNFGPTLFQWLEKKHPKIAKKIIEADKESLSRLGHGNALAQVYNHIIMPLASYRDQITQIRWAKSYFKSRFNRNCEGIWLSETAINMTTVNCLIQEEIRFVVLSPTQAEAFRDIDGKTPWISANDGSIDTTQTYRIYGRASNGERINGHLDIFFFNEGLSKEVSFGNLLDNALTLGTKINSCYNNSSQNQAIVIATDGETFGHHKPFGDMCLAYFFKYVAKELDIIPVNFGFYLEKNPPKFEVMLKNEFGEGTAWSCQHGVGRWSRDCGCNAGESAGWNQSWRGPLRQAFNSLQQIIDEEFVTTLMPFISNPWKLRDRYIDICHATTIQSFKTLLIQEGVSSEISDDQTMLIRRFLESQKYMLFAFTSCGWFFSELSGIETVQNIAYAGRSIGLALLDKKRTNIINSFLMMLSQTKSNFPGKDGATIFHTAVTPYLNHLPILCFTAIMETLFTSTKTDSGFFEYYSYKVKFDKQNNFLKETNGSQIYFLTIINEKNGEAAFYYFLISQDSGQIQAKYIPSSNSSEIVNLSLDEEEFNSHPKATNLTVSNVFPESKMLLSRYFINQISKDTEEKYWSWMENNKTNLDFLAELGVSLPEFIAAPIAYVLTYQWNTTLNEIEIYGQEDSVFSRLLALWNMSNKYSISINYAESSRLLLDLLTAELNLFTETLSIVSSERMRYLLNIVDRFKIPFSKNKIEDLFYPLLGSAIKSIYNIYKASDDNSQKETIIKLLHFARRMNFNTDAFPIT